MHNGRRNREYDVFPWRYEPEARNAIGSASGREDISFTAIWANVLRTVDSTVA
jgi:hypothetical protein